MKDYDKALDDGLIAMMESQFGDPIYAQLNARLANLRVRNPRTMTGPSAAQLDAEDYYREYIGDDGYGYWEGRGL